MEREDIQAASCQSNSIVPYECLARRIARCKDARSSDADEMLHVDGVNMNIAGKVFSDAVSGADQSTTEVEGLTLIVRIYNSRGATRERIGRTCDVLRSQPTKRTTRMSSSPA